MHALNCHQQSAVRITHAGGEGGPFRAVTRGVCVCMCVCVCVFVWAVTRGIIPGRMSVCVCEWARHKDISISLKPCARVCVCVCVHVGVCGYLHVNMCMCIHVGAPASVCVC